MTHQNTTHVMKCDLGKWYSDDKKTAFKVLERDEKSTFVKITFGSGATKESQTNDNSVIRQENKNNLLASEGKIDYNQVDKQIIQEEQNTKLHAPIEVTSDEFQNQLAPKAIDGNQEQDKGVETQMEVNEERSKEDDYYQNSKIYQKYQNRNGRITSLLTENAAFFVTVAILNLTMAVLITMFCFIFPNAFENVKLSMGNAWGWLKHKFGSVITLALELHNLGMRAVKVALSPFDWMWRFLGCVGKCLGVRMPTITMPIVRMPNITMPTVRMPNITMPTGNITMPQWLSCMFNCFKSD